MFYSSVDFPALSEFENNFAQIKKELLTILNKPLIEIYNSTWVGERPNYLTNPLDKSTAWKTYTFRFFGINHIPNLESCPAIRNILDKFPTIVTAEFSLLEPNTHILPHKGYTNKLLRAHLGLIIPNGDIGIRVDEISSNWEEGKLLIFDDSIEHEAWNNTNQQRVVFMFDFEPHFNTMKSRNVCTEVLQKTNDSHLLNISPRENWLEWLAEGNFPYIK